MVVTMTVIMPMIMLMLRRRPQDVAHFMLGKLHLRLALPLHFSILKPLTRCRHLHVILYIEVLKIVLIREVEELLLQLLIFLELRRLLL